MKEEIKKDIDNEKDNYYISLLDFYLQKKMKIHIELVNGRFYNGLVDEISNDRIIFNDSSLGQMPVYFSQIKIVEKYRDKVEVESK